MRTEFDGSLAIADGDLSITDGEKTYTRTGLKLLASLLLATLLQSLAPNLSILDFLPASNPSDVNKIVCNLLEGPRLFNETIRSE